MAYPDRATAEKELILGKQLNPGGWVAHSHFVALAAERIAAAAGMDSEKACILGLLHDIGRRCGIPGQYHIYAGYAYSLSKGWDEIARISITHSFLLKDTSLGVSPFNGTPEENIVIENYMRNIEFDDYDLLIQLCDALGTDKGLCIIEKRIVDVALRYGLLPGSLEKWRKFFELKAYFDAKCGTSIYNLLPEIKENLE